jgi:glycosyltransferase involved in cell wall biosynthesis
VKRTGEEHVVSAESKTPRETLRLAVVLPVYNHGRSVGSVIDAVRGLLLEAPLIVIDDGSTDRTPEVLRSAQARDAAICVVRQDANHGKGQALLRGFAQARELGATHVLTIDADGQHHAPDMLGLLAVARGHPLDLVVGMRDMDAAQVPARSRAGRNISRFWLQLQTGCDIPDSQCGLRVYPLAQVLAVPHRFKRFDFETEVLARLAWAGVRIRSVPVRCIYFPAGERVTHFRPLVDTLRGIRANVFLVFRRIAPVPFGRLGPPPPPPLPAHPRSVGLRRWWSPAAWKRALLRILRTGTSNAEFAAAFALGVFVGLTPLYGLHALIAIYLARRLHLNILAAVIGTNISIPPLVPVWIYLSVSTGNLLAHGQWLTRWSDVTPGAMPAALLGNLVVALLTAAASLLIVRAMLYCFRRGVSRD